MILAGRANKMQNYINQVYWGPSWNTYYNGSKVTISAKKEVDFNNPLMVPGKDIIKWGSVYNFQANKTVPQLPLLQINQRYRISIKASSEPAQGFFTRIVFFNGQGDEISRLEFHNLEKAFTFPEGAVHYEVSLVNTGCTSLQFKRLEICPAKLPRSVHNDLWFHKPVNSDSDQPVNIVVMHDPKRVKKTWETVGKMLNGLPLQIISIGWQYNGDLADAIVHWIEQKNQLYAHLISTSADLDKVLRKVHQASPKTQLLLTEESRDDKLHIDYEIYASRDIPEWSTANLVDPEWITITHAINGLWGGVKVK